MHPLLFKLGPLSIHSYGFLIAIGFLCAMAVVRRLSVREKLPVDRMLDLTFYCLASGFLGARVLFVITRWQDYVRDPLSIFKIWEGGLVFFGGLIAALPVGVYYLRRHKINIWKALDVALPALTIAHSIGRLGCLAAGCCYGRPTEGGWGVRLNSELVDRALQGVPLHPVQLYESSALFILFLGLLSVSKRKSFDGQVALTYYMAYPIIRSIVEVFRGDTIRGFVIGDWLSTSQFISILVFLAALGGVFYRLRGLSRTPKRSRA